MARATFGGESENVLIKVEKLTHFGFAVPLQEGAVVAGSKGHTSWDLWTVGSQRFRGPGERQRGKQRTSWAGKCREAPS